MPGLTYRGTFLSDSNPGQRSASRATQYHANLTLSLAQEISEYSVQNGQVRLTTICLKISEGHWWCHRHRDHRGHNPCSKDRIWTGLPTLQRDIPVKQTEAKRNKDEFLLSLAEQGGWNILEKKQGRMPMSMHVFRNISCFSVPKSLLPTAESFGF